MIHDLSRIRIKSKRCHSNRSHHCRVQTIHDSPVDTHRFQYVENRCQIYFRQYTGNTSQECRDLWFESEVVLLFE